MIPLMFLLRRVSTWAGSLQERLSCTTRDIVTGSVEVVLCSTVTVESIWEARQNEGFGLLLPVTNYYGQYYTGFGIFWFMLIIYYGRYAPMAVLSRKMAFGLPNFLVWIFTI